jgi:hypothetical protein
VTFPWPLDHGLLQRAISVRGAGGEIHGDVRIGAGEVQWLFTPSEPWVTGAYSLVVSPELEDPAGNRLGRAFEVMERVSEPAKAVTLFFAVK